MQKTQDDHTFGKAAGAGSEKPWKKRSPFDISAIFFSCTQSDSRPTLTASLALAFTVEVCFQLKNRKTEATGGTCSDNHLLALQVFF